MTSNKKSRATATLKHSLSVEIHEPRLELFESLRFMDIDALSKAKAVEVVIGEIDGGCCQRKVYAMVRKGMVAGIRAEECPKEERTTLSREYAQLVSKAMKRVRAKRRGGRKLPVPVAAFFGNATTARLITVQTLFCIRVCFPFGVCITCCVRTDKPNAPVLCGRVTIDTTVPD